MEMHGSVSTFGVGELGAIVHKILEVAGRTMALFSIFEVVIIMSKGLALDRWLVCCTICMSFSVNIVLRFQI